MRRLDPFVFAHIVKALTEKTEFRVGGFFIMADFVTNTAMFALINRDTPLRIGEEGKKDANFASVAGSKFGMVFAHRKDTGFEQTTLLGEVDFKGGHVSADGEFGYIFSGAPHEIDLALMRYAEDVHNADKSPGAAPSFLG